MIQEHNVGATFDRTNNVAIQNLARGQYWLRFFIDRACFVSRVVLSSGVTVSFQSIGTCCMCCQHYVLHVLSVPAHNYDTGVIRRKMLLRGYCTSYQKLACFVLYLKIINNFVKNKLCIL